MNLKSILDVYKSVLRNRNTRTYICTTNKIMKGQIYMENEKKMYVTAEKAVKCD